MLSLVSLLAISALQSGFCDHLLSLVFRLRQRGNCAAHHSHRCAAADAASV